jgi:hypothetical protein
MATEISTHQPQHKFVCEQVVEVDCDSYNGLVQICVLLQGTCEAHSAPMYGCSAGDLHFSFCEVLVKPLSPALRRSMN